MMHGNGENELTTMIPWEDLQSCCAVPSLRNKRKISHLELAVLQREVIAGLERAAGMVSLLRRFLQSQTPELLTSFRSFPGT